MQKIILLLVFTIFSLGQVKPIKEENAKWVGLTAGIGTGMLAGFIAYDKINPDLPKSFWFNHRTHDQNVIKPILIGSGIGLVVAFLAYKLAMYNTAKSKFNRAQNIINTVSFKSIVAKKFATQELLLQYIFGSYRSSWPLVSAVDDLNSIRLDLIEAKLLLNNACNEVMTNKRDLWIYEQSKKLFLDIEDFLERVTLRLSILTSNNMYQQQLKSYQKYQRKLEKQRERERKRRDKWKEQRRKEDLVYGITQNSNGNVGVNISL